MYVRTPKRFCLDPRSGCMPCIFFLRNQKGEARRWRGVQRVQRGGDRMYQQLLLKSPSSFFCRADQCTGPCRPKCLEKNTQCKHLSVSCCCVHTYDTHKCFLAKAVCSKVAGAYCVAKRLPARFAHPCRSSLRRLLSGFCSSSAQFCKAPSGCSRSQSSPGCAYSEQCAC